MSLNGKNTALLIIDLQIGSFLDKLIYKDDELLKNIQFLISKARIEQAPIFSRNTMVKQEPLITKEILDGKFIRRSLF